MAFSGNQITRVGLGGPSGLTGSFAGKSQEASGGTGWITIDIGIQMAWAGLLALTGWVY